MRGFSYLCIAFAAGLGSVTARAEAQVDKNSIVLEPLSPWAIDFADDKCRLARTFGKENALHVLFFEIAGPGSAPGMTVAGPAMESLGPLRNVKLALVEGETVRGGQPYRGDLGTVGRAVIYPGVEIAPNETLADGDASSSVVMGQVDLDFADKVTDIRLTKGKKSVVLQTGKMRAPFEALNVCSADLVRHWGLDADKHRAYLKRPVWKNQQQIARRIQDFYPSDALRKGESVIIRMRVTVEIDGSVSDCNLQYATKADYLESPACGKMKHAKFEPALDLDGQPMRSYYITRITYITN